VRHPVPTPAGGAATSSEPGGGTGASAAGSEVREAAQLAKKLAYKEQRELAALPARIEALESEHTQLQASIASPEFYKEGAEHIARTMARASEVEQELLAAYARWDELDSRSRT
jgi:ATP-binding cassette subfamily F protein uup